MLTFAHQIAAQILKEERERETAREAAMDAAVAKPPPARVTKENWEDWHRRGWIVCPANRQKTCSDPACGVGANCKRMAELGLAGDGSALRRDERPPCGARTQSGTPCLVRVEPGKRRCRLHGGLSTGPRTPEGKARIAAAQRKRWTRYRGSGGT
jgi:hypothetical protein